MAYGLPGTSLNSARLVRVLANLAVADVVESKQSLARVLASVTDSSQKSALAALFVELFKGLRYTERIRQTIESPSG